MTIRATEAESALLITLGERARRRRRSLHLSRATVAGVCGISAQYLGEIERGQANPTVLLVARLSRVLGFKLELMVTDAVDTVIGQTAGRLSAGGGAA